VQASPEAEAAWKRVLAATASAGGLPITAFRLEADVLTRSGAQTNETEIDYRYLAPDCIRFVLPNRLETGRFGAGREDYWLKDKEEVVVLAGRDYVEDRRQVDEMLALARNYVALSEPARLNLRRLELLGGAPADLPPSLAAAGKKLSWIAVSSPDFALVRRDGEPAPKDALYTVEIGLRTDGLPSLVVIRDGSRKSGDRTALLVELGKYEEKSGFKIPLQLRVHARRPDGRAGFVDSPSQEIYVTTTDLRAPLTREDFRP
jgi:hypothetical protein